MSSGDRFAGALQRVTALLWRHQLPEILRQEADLARSSDDELREAIWRFVSTPKITSLAAEPKGLGELLGGPLTDQEVEALAHAVSAFSRFPAANLPPGTRLFDEQVLAAGALMGGGVVQLNTGEGKTFAIAAAALGLLRFHTKVYIMTANAYLAARDAALTAPFWHGLGISVGRALPNEFGHKDEHAWDAQVVYTTLPALNARTLLEDCGNAPRTLVWSAVLLDEADAVLLDQSAQHQHLVRFTHPATKDWSKALEVAAALGEDDVAVDRVQGLITRITPQGEKTIQEQFDDKLPIADWLLLLNDVELAYTATRVAVAGHDYEVLGDRVVTIDPETGWHTPGIRTAWLAPLSQSLGFAGEPHKVVVHSVDGITTLKRFSHIAGASGTVAHDAMEYGLLLDLFPAVVPPRRPRQAGRQPDFVAKSREVAHQWIVKQVSEHGLQRPVMIATGSTHEARDLATLIRRDAPPGIAIRAAFGETIADGRLFEDAGRPGITIVSTRIAGRGVDIRLTEEARRNGGTLLIIVGHGEQPRFDRQLLGRVGRQSDPYSARFISHPDDPFIRRMTNGGPMFKKAVGLSDTEPISAKMLDKQIALAQRALRLLNLGTFAGRVITGEADREVFEMLHDWRQALGPKQEGRLPAAFTTLLTERLIGLQYSGLASAPDDERIDPNTIVGDLVELLGRAEDRRNLLASTIGQPASRGPREARPVRDRRCRRGLRRQHPGTAGAA